MYRYDHLKSINNCEHINELLERGIICAYKDYYRVNSSNAFDNIFDDKLCLMFNDGAYPIDYCPVCGKIIEYKEVNNTLELKNK